MAIEIINVGASPNDGNGDPIRDAFIKCNDNFDELETTKINGSGTDDYIPKFNGPDAIENSQIFDNGTNVIVGATSGPHKFSVNGKIGGNIFGDSFLEFTSGGNTLLKANDDVIIGYSQNTIVKQNGNVGIGTAIPLITATNRGNLTINGSNDAILVLGNAGVYSGYLYADSLRIELSSNTQPIAFATNGGERMRITSNGNVGIGTTSPLQKLHVEGLSYFGSDIFTLNNGGIFFSGNNSYQRGIYSNTSGLTLQTLGSPKVTITDGGNVGIGTTSPTAKLHINNGTDRNLWFRVNGSGTGTELLSINDAQSTRQSLAFSASSFYFDNGNVGIGTTSPSEKLQIYSSSNTAFSVVDSASSIRMITAGGINFFQSGPVGGGASPLVFSSMFGGLEYMRITSSGNVGIGTTSPVDKLEVNGGIRSTGLNGFTRINDGVLSASRADGLYLIQEANAPMIMWTNNTERMRITSSGNVGIGLTSPNPSALLHLKSTTQGFLPPVMKTGERDNIGSPAIGLVIFNEDSQTIEVYTTAGWKSLLY